MMALRQPLKKTTHKLSSLLKDWVDWPVDAVDCEVTGITRDSRAVVAGDLFVACRGGARHALEFAEQAIKCGAVAVVYEPPTAGISSLPPQVPFLPLARLGERVGELAARFYDQPSRDLLVFGVTGTNGKTSCSHFIAQGFAGREPAACAVIGTLGNGLPGSLEPATHTTPDAISLQRLLSSFRSAGCRAVAMEVSSHGLEQGRVNAVKFDIAVFTNLSRDHLDYHGDMAHYGAAKKQLFTFPALRSAVLNLADPFSKEISDAISSNVDIIGYLLGQSSGGLSRSHRCLQGTIVRSDRRTMVLRLTGSWGNHELTTGLLGEFTAMNLLAAAAALLQSGLDLHEVVARLSLVQGVPGRMEPFGVAGRPLVFVDYAHTPDAMQHALHAARKYCQGRLWCVFGCGGNRDRGKRPQMGAIAEKLADRVVVTNDNPRDERPEDIVSEIKYGLKAPSAVTFIHDRAEAIEYAIAHAGPDDVVLVAGKGHEEYQEISGVRRDFSDRKLVRRLVGDVGERVTPC